MPIPIPPELIWPAPSLTLAASALCQQAVTRLTMFMFRVMPVGLVVLTGMANGLIGITGAAALVVLTLLLWRLRIHEHAENVKSRPLLAALFSATLVLLVALMMHQVPGFTAVVIADPVQYSPLSLPTTMVISLDKALAGFLLLAILGPPLLGPQPWRRTLRFAVPMTLATIVLVIGGAVYSGHIRYDLKWHALAPMWMFGNLVLTCVAEEALFRGFLQQRLADTLRMHRYGTTISVVCIAVLFGVAHLSGGLTFAALATLAGLGYGAIYARTQSLSAAILAHFIVNLTHFIGYTYPAMM